MPKSTKIIIVDDNRDGADTWRMMLKIHGYEPRVAYDAETALSMYEAEVPDVLLADIAMPKMSGNDMVKILRAKPEAKNILFVALSGFGDAAHRTAAIEAGFDHFFVKPADIDPVMELLANIERAAALRNKNA